MAETVRIELTTLPPEGSALPLRYVSLVAVDGVAPPWAVYETAARLLGHTASLVPGEGLEPPMRAARLIYGQLPYHWTNPGNWSARSDSNRQGACARPHLKRMWLPNFTTCR